MLHHVTQVYRLTKRIGKVSSNCSRPLWTLRVQTLRARSRRKNWLSHLLRWSVQTCFRGRQETRNGLRVVSAGSSSRDRDTWRNADAAQQRFSDDSVVCQGGTRFSSWD